MFTELISESLGVSADVKSKTYICSTGINHPLDPFKYHLHIINLLTSSIFINRSRKYLSLPVEAEKWNAEEGRRNCGGCYGNTVHVSMHKSWWVAVFVIRVRESRMLRYRPLLCKSTSGTPWYPPINDKISAIYKPSIVWNS